MPDPLTDYLVTRIDRPWAWSRTFGLAGVIAGTVIGSDENGLVGVAVGVPIGFAAGALIGLGFGLIAWVVCRLIGGLDRPVKCPGRWAQNLRCVQCDYRTSPAGPWRVRDCMTPPETCPACGGGLVMTFPDCPRCAGRIMAGEGLVRDMLALVRIPKSLDQALRGHFRRKHCGCIYDKWGRDVAPDRPTWDGKKATG